MTGKKRKRPPSEPDPIVEARLKQRRRVRFALFITALALALSVLMTHWGRSGEDDWVRFDRRRVTVVSVSLNGSVNVQVLNDPGETRVRLLGMDMPRAGTVQAADCGRELASHALGREFTLRLEPVQTRSPDNALLAYLFLSDTDNLGLGMVRDGYAYADRRSPHSLQVQFEQAESDARKKRRGLWKSPSDADMPEWRVKWLNELREKRHRKEPG